MHQSTLKVYLVYMAQKERFIFMDTLKLRWNSFVCM